MNKIFHNRRLTVLHTCLGFWIGRGFKYAKVINIWQDSEYASSSEYPTFTHGFIENGLSYSSSSQYNRSGIYKTREYVKVTQDSV